MALSIVTRVGGFAVRKALNVSLKAWVFAAVGSELL